MSKSDRAAQTLCALAFEYGRARVMFPDDDPWLPSNDLPFLSKKARGYATAMFVLAGHHENGCARFPAWYAEELYRGTREHKFSPELDAI